MADLFMLRSQSMPQDTRVVGFRGSEAVSRLYAFEVFLQIAGQDAHSFEVADAVGAKASLLVSRDDDRDPFVFAGVFSEVALIHETDERTLVRGMLVPRFWNLSQTRHSRIFTQRSIPDILTSVLDENGFSSDDYELRLTGQYKPEEHVCQYSESDFDFLSRWMEREGLYYFFEHAEDGEKLIIADNKSAHKDLATSAIRYFPQGGKDVTSGEHLELFVCRQRRTPGSVSFKDYDYNKPTLEVSGTASIAKNGVGEIHFHGGRVFTPDRAKHLSTIRAEQIKSLERVFTGSGTALYLRSGATFDLAFHPRTAFDAKYLAVEVEHQGNQLAGSSDLRRLTGLDIEEVYRVHVTAIPADTQFRALDSTAWPRIYGTEHGTIDGEAESEYAQIDEHGRYLVRFAFDESGLNDGRASTWVRMMQPHGGDVEGWHFPLRKGTEVLFTFLGGDPDRPVIAGVVPNALKPSPVTRTNHTKNVIQTGGRNRVEMDDKEGQERITISTPFASSRIEMGAPGAAHEMVLATDGSALHSVGGRMDLKVEGEMSETVTGDTIKRHLSSATEIIGGAFQQTFQGPVTQIWHGLVQRTKTGNDLSITLGASSKTTVGVSNSNFIGGQANLSVGAFSSIKVSGELSLAIGASASLKLANELSLTGGLRISAKAGLDININAAPKIDLKTVHVDAANTALKKAAEYIVGTGVLVVA